MMTKKTELNHVRLKPESRLHKIPKSLPITIHAILYLCLKKRPFDFIIYSSILLHFLLLFYIVFPIFSFLRTHRTSFIATVIYTNTFIFTFSYRFKYFGIPKTCTAT